ncbi:hypothetical protein [Nocardia sp. BMG51109]|uniref:hypothetical protein n=1 Tax=Nocardia sp. BMG51109 TaxID=1056816 RepID=UPI0004635BB9|nr:hypothetical protein [Nocardia sp. BMG51109]
MNTVVQVSTELWRVTVAALVFGAGLPAIFALGVRFQSHATTGADGTATTGADGTATVSPTRRRAATAAAALCFAAVLAVIVAAVLFVAKAFLASRLGIHLFGQG